MLALGLILLQQAVAAPPVMTVPPAPLMPPVQSAVETLPRGPRPKDGPMGWIRPGDYPPLAVKNGESGVVGFTLTIDAKGAVNNCVVVATSGSAALDRATCDLLRARAEFQPALDGAGKPVAGSYTNRTRWLLPSPVDLPKPGELIFHYVVETDGRQVECRVEKATGGMEARFKQIGSGCPAVRFREPFKDEQGNPVRRHVTLRQSLVVEP